MYIETEEAVLQNGSLVKVFWSPTTILPFEKLDPDSYTVDITLREQDVQSGEWKELATLASNITNNGSATVTILVPEFVDDNGDMLHPLIIEVGVSSDSMTIPRQKWGLFSNILTKIGQFGLRILKQAPVRFIQMLIRQAAYVQRNACEVWANTGSSNIGPEINSRLPPCPCTSSLAREPNSGFKEEKFSSVVKIAGTVQDYFGTTLIDDTFRRFFHPNTASCYRQRVTKP